jgi:hypothetical protein
MTCKKKIAILQSNYIPWKGYFDLINMVDEFIIYDTAQYTKNDWRNRNKIQTQNGLLWLTIPVQQANLSQLIIDTKVSDKSWAKKHWKSLIQNYSKAEFFQVYKEVFEDLYLGNQEEYLSLINYKFIIAINDVLGIDTKIQWSSEFDLVDGQTERLLGICKDCQAETYISGPAAKDYLDESLFEAENIKVEWMDYSGYPEYSQMYSLFEHGVSSLDLIFNEGPHATSFMKSFQ